MTHTKGPLADPVTALGRRGCITVFLRHDPFALLRITRSQSLLCSQSGGCQPWLLVLVHGAPPPKYRTRGQHPCFFGTSGMIQICSMVENQCPERHIYATDSQNLIFRVPWDAPYSSSLRGGWTGPARCSGPFETVCTGGPSQSTGSPVPGHWPAVDDIERGTLGPWTCTVQQEHGVYFLELTRV